MILSKYNKFIFSIFSDNREYLILSLYIVKKRERFIAFLKIHYTKAYASGKFMPSYVCTTRLTVIDCTDWDILFSTGKIIFKEDQVKIEFSSNIAMIYLNYTWEKHEITPRSELGKDISGNETVRWNSFDFSSTVNGHFITPYSTTEFKNAIGNIDLFKANKFPVTLTGLFWSRMHHENYDLSYYFIFNSAIKSYSKLLLSHGRRLVEFLDLDFIMNNEKTSSRIPVNYPENVHLSARNDSYEVVINIYDSFEVNDREMADTGFLERIFDDISWRRIGNPRGLRLLSKADIIINNDHARTEISGITSIGEYIIFA
jgi:hypothetical protein